MRTKVFSLSYLSNWLIGRYEKIISSTFRRSLSINKSKNLPIFRCNSICLESHWVVVGLKIRAVNRSSTEKAQCGTGLSITHHLGIIVPVSVIHVFILGFSLTVPI